jgi:peptide/nickel transport system ATP-binding protein/oligopeptide transport system ATP-binding protein
MSGTASLLELRDVHVRFPVHSGVLQRTVGLVHAVDGVNLAVRRGETMGLVGESGCGKSTLSRVVVMLTRPDAGEVLFEGRNILAFDRNARKLARRDIQIIFQDSLGALNPRLRVRDLILEGRRIQGLSDTATDRGVVDDILGKVGLSRELATRYPHELSGGQRQRVGIARVLVLGARLIVADEPVSALDVSVQAQVLNLLVDLKRDLGLTYIFIAHSLAVVGYIADRIAVMYLGRIVEMASSETIQSAPLHPYTVSLLSSVPDPSARVRHVRGHLAGEPPSPMHLPSGCRFRTRCVAAQTICAEREPALTEQPGGHFVACHFPGVLPASDRARPQTVKC